MYTIVESLYIFNTKIHSPGQASSKCTSQFLFLNLTSNIFSLVYMNNDLAIRLDFMNQNEYNENPKIMHFSPWNIGSAIFCKSTI